MGWEKAALWKMSQFEVTLFASFLSPYINMKSNPVAVYGQFCYK